MSDKELSYAKELKYLNSISKLKRPFAVEYEVFYMWFDSERVTYDSDTKVTSNYIDILKEILDDNNIPFSTNIDDIWVKIIVRISDVTAKLRDDKLNSILND